MYYVLIKNGKIIHYRGSIEYLKTDCEKNDIPFVQENVVETEEEPVLYKGELRFKTEVYEQDMIRERQKEKRAQAYLVEVDPITVHIQRERDEADPDEEKIAALIAERAEKVAEIKARYPYPEESEVGDGEV